MTFLGLTRTHDVGKYQKKSIQLSPMRLNSYHGQMRKSKGKCESGIFGKDGQVFEFLEN